MNPFISKSLDLIQEGFQIGVAVIMASLGLKAFLLPNGFLDGGVTGIAIILSNSLDIEISYVLPVITLPFLILGWVTVSKRIVWKSMVAVLLLAIVLHYENFQSVTEDKLLIAIFGGIFLGAGIGIAIKNGAVLDGSEILGIYLHEKFGVSIGRVVLVFNTILFGVTALLFSIETALYSILTFLVTGKVIDFIFQGFEDYIGMWIISEKSTQIEEELINELGTGLTLYQGLSGYGKSGQKKPVQLIKIILNRIDSKKTYRTISSIDKEAFIVEFEINQIHGGVLRKYLPKVQLKEVFKKLK